jgi:hypothetical protein
MYLNFFYSNNSEQYFHPILFNFVISQFCFDTIWNFVAKFWTLSKLRNFRLIMQNQWKKTIKSISQLPTTRHFYPSFIVEGKARSLPLMRSLKTGVDKCTKLQIYSATYCNKRFYSRGPCWFEPKMKNCIAVDLVIAKTAPRQSA